MTICVYNIQWNAPTEYRLPHCVVVQNRPGDVVSAHRIANWLEDTYGFTPLTWGFVLVDEVVDGSLKTVEDEYRHSTFTY